jgi:hypothetical protein
MLGGCASRDIRVRATRPGLQFLLSHPDHLQRPRMSAGVPVSDQARLAEIETLANDLLAYAEDDDRMIHMADAGYVMQLIADVPYLLAALREAERRTEEAESKLATATDTIRSLTALASEREAT